MPRFSLRTLIVVMLLAGPVGALGWWSWTFLGWVGLGLFLSMLTVVLMSGFGGLQAAEVLVGLAALAILATLIAAH